MILCCWLCYNLVDNYVCCLLSTYDVVNCVTTRLQPGFDQKRFLLLNRFFAIRYIFKSDLSCDLWEMSENVYLSQVLRVVKTRRMDWTRDTWVFLFHTEFDYWSPWEKVIRVNGVLRSKGVQLKQIYSRKSCWWIYYKDFSCLG